MTPQLFIEIALAPALKLLPLSMDSKEARVLVLAICLQESGLVHRTQIGGPARGYPQFEQAGISGVLTHKATAMTAATICGTLNIPSESGAVYEAIAFNDILAAAFARLLLWTLPNPLPTLGDVWAAWYQYVAAWKPGKPQSNRWQANYEAALKEV